MPTSALLVVSIVIVLFINVSSPCCETALDYAAKGSTSTGVQHERRRYFSRFEASGTAVRSFNLVVVLVVNIFLHCSADTATAATRSTAMDRGQERVGPLARRRCSRRLDQRDGQGQGQ